MESTTGGSDDVTDIAGFHPDEVSETGSVSSQRADRFYDRIRNSIRRYVENRGKGVEKTAEFLLFVPDIFILLWRLTTDPRIQGKNKVLLGSGVAYYLFPLDIVPEALFGPIGFLDDLVFAVYILNKLLSDTDESVLREHWSGDDDLLDVIRRVLGAADGLVTTDLLKQIKKLVR